ncbi:MAG: SMP-30/gluconolactonase/LRE family protein, partial [Phycisphaerae bacterium]|nr:SMP-30/gluconolactonase/LRE family protein [Phycisphaerae bacterium]
MSTRSRHALAVVLIFELLSCGAGRGLAADVDEFRVKRADVFEFAEKPTVKRDGDRVVISFAAKAACDVTVAVEDAGGRTVRHLASGVLGANAPEPFQKSSLNQTVIWDGKDNRGRAIDDLTGCKARVSLGLAPRFERSLYHSPAKPWGRNQPVIAPRPEGVYVYEGDNVDSIKLFDHDGNYVRTIYPFPADKLEQVKGLRWRQAVQDGLKVPFKEGFFQSTFLTSGYNSGYDVASGYGVTHFPSLAYSWAEDAPDFPAATAFAVSGKRIALVGVLGVNRLSTDGSTGEMDLIGPSLDFTATERALQSPPRSVRVSPRSAALSPDGKWLYLTGYCWADDSKFSHMYGGGKRWLNGVLRIRFDAQAGPEAFVGTTRPDGEPGSGPDQLYSPTSVACDAQGNVYVADSGNNRVQVFSPDGKLVESIPSQKPVHVAVHQKTGELFVSSWNLRNFAAGWDKKAPFEVVRLGPAGKRDKIASYALPLITGSMAGEEGYSGLQYRVEVDTWADPPTVWLIAGATFMHGWYDLTSLSGQRGAIKMLIADKDKLTLKRDFSAEAVKTIARADPSSNSRQLLTVNPRTGKLCVMESRISSSQVVEIDPETGAARLMDLPHAADDICFDMEGHVYLNAGSYVTRFNPDGLREVPWDYGEERTGLGAGGHGEKSVDVVAALALPGTRPPIDEKCATSGLWMSPKGMLAVHCWNGESYSSKSDRKADKTLGEAGRRYVPRVYPGRQRWGEVHVWDSHGKVRYEDATPGLGFLDGVAIDKEDNLYVLAGAARTLDGQGKLNPKSCTLIKFKPGAGKVLTAGDKMVPVPLKPREEPKEPSQLAGRWVSGAEWMYGGVGYCGWEWCSRFALDFYAR